MTVERTVSANDARVTVLFAGVVLAILAVSALRPPVSYDAFWHLAMGRDFVQHGWLPWVDHHSFTYAGSEIVSPPYPFQVLLFVLVEWFGLEAGFSAYKLASYAALVGTALVWFRKVDAPIALICLCFACIALLATLRTAVRPELLSYALSIVALILAERAGTRFTARTMLPLVALMVIWSNYHTAVFGYVLLFGMFVDAGLAMRRARAPRAMWLGWAGWGTILVLAGFVNPSVTHTLITLLTFSNEWKSLIQEYEPPVLYAGIVGLYVCLALAVYAIALAVRARRAGSLFVCALLLANALDTARLVAPAGIVIIALVPMLWRASRQQDEAASGFAHPRLATAAIALLSLIPLGSAARLAHTYAHEHAAAARLYPSTTVDYMETANIGGRVFNAYETGGYLAYRLGPSVRVFIDGRTGILYPLKHHHAFLAAERSSAMFANTVDQYDIDAALVHNTLEQHHVIVRSGRMSLDFVGRRYALYRAGQGNFAHMGRLQIYPACWRTAHAVILDEERDRALALLPADSSLLPFAALVADFGNTTNRGNFLDQLGDGSGLTDPQRRFAGYRALDEGNFRLAYALFAGIALREPKDPLAAAVALLGADAPELAGEALAAAARTEWPRLGAHDLQLMQALLKRVNPRAAGIRSEFIAQVDAGVKQAGARALAGEISAASFCK